MSYLILPPPSATGEHVKIDLAAIRERGVSVSPVGKALAAAEADGFYGYAVEVYEDGKGTGVLLYIPNAGTLHGKLKGVR